MVHYAICIKQGRNNVSLKPCILKFLDSCDHEMHILESNRSKCFNLLCRIDKRILAWEEWGEDNQ